MEDFSSLVRNRKPGEVIDLADGRKIVVGIDGEYDVVKSLRDFSSVPSCDEDGISFRDDSIKLGRGQAVKFAFGEIRPDEWRVVRHRWPGGLSLVCPKLTSVQMLAQADEGRACPLCGLLDISTAWFFPVVRLASRKTGAQWVADSQCPTRILRVNERMYKQWLAAAQSGVDPQEVVFIAGRNEDEFGSYFLEPTLEPAPKREGQTAPPMLTALRVEDAVELEALAATLTAARGLEPQLGRVAKWRRIFPRQPLIAYWWGRKKPVLGDYRNPEKHREWMLDEGYLRSMDEGRGIGLWLSDGYAAVDLDRDQDVECFMAANPWTRQTFSKRGGRGITFIVKIQGDCPQRTIHAFCDGNSVGEFRFEDTVIIDNLHPSGKLYEVSQANEIAEITYSQIQWPDGWAVESPKCREFERNFGGNIEGGLLDLSLLKNVRPHPNKNGALQAQCPACAEDGSDKSGNHLILFQGGEGKYGCVVEQSAEHYSRIFELARHPRFRQRERDREQVEGLAKLSALEYDRRREDAAKELGVRPATLDKSVAAARSELTNAAKGDELGFDEAIESWPEAVDGAELLEALAKTLERFMILSDPAVVAMTLWIVLSHCFELFIFSPILNVRSPTKRCGKSKLLALLDKLVPRPLKADSISDAVIFRAIDAWKPTLLLDEWDSQRPEMQEAIRNVLNSGFERGGCTWRCAGDEHVPTRFPTYCPKVVAGIGSLPDTAESRSIAVVLRRKLKTEKVERLRTFEGTELRRKIVRWVADNKNELLSAHPALPEELDDREQDIWEPLFAVGDLCGWGERSRRAALQLCGRPDSESQGVELLADIRAEFARLGRQVDRLPTERLLKALNDLDDRPWATFQNGKPLGAHGLSQMLAKFEIKSATIAIGRARPKGYLLKWFEDAFARYLPPEAENKTVLADDEP